MASKKKDQTNVVERTRDYLGKAVKNTRDASRKRGARVALTAVNLQKNVFNSSVDLLGRGQDRGGKALTDIVKKSEWMPTEGRQVVGEWVGLAKQNREAYKRVMNKSFGLVERYFKRIESGKVTTTKAATRKKPVAKKATRKRTAATA